MAKRKLTTKQRIGLAGKQAERMQKAFEEIYPEEKAESDSYFKKHFYPVIKSFKKKAIPAILAAGIGLQSLLGIASAQESQPKNPAIEQKQEEKSNEIYAIGGYSRLNPTDYNAKLAEVSVGEGFGNTFNYGLGYRRLNFPAENYNLGLEFSMNSQSIDKLVRNISTNEQRKFGTESLKLYNLDAAFEKDFNLIENKRLKAFVKAGPSLEYSIQESSNEEKSIKSDPILQLGMKAAAGIRYYLGDLFVEGEIGNRLMFGSPINTSCLTAGIKAGWRF